MPAKKPTDAFKATAHSIPGDLPRIEAEFVKWLDGGFLSKKHIAIVRLSIQGKGKQARTFDTTLSKSHAPRRKKGDEDEEPDGREGFTLGETVPAVWRTAALDVAILVIGFQWSHEYAATPVEKRPKFPF